MRADLGRQWAERRNALLEEGCGSLTQVRAIVAAARRQGVLED